jgi:hypothetical protein
MTLWCLRALRGETSFFIKCKKITTKKLKVAECKPGEA